jgi:hypothetical protein
LIRADNLQPFSIKDLNNGCFANYSLTNSQKIGSLSRKAEVSIKRIADDNRSIVERLKVKASVCRSTEAAT